MRHERCEFARFVGRVHGRYVLLRLLERSALGMLAGCMVALPLLAIVWWRGLPTMPVAMGALGLGWLAGFLWGAIARPTGLEVAMETDRQLDWADLLVSAWSLREQAGDDPWAAAVTAAADARCRVTSPGSVLLMKLGARAWGGIGLAAALVLVLALLPTYAAPSRAEENASSPLSTITGLGDAEGMPRVARSVSRRTTAEQQPDDPHASRMTSADTEPDESNRQSTFTDQGHAKRDSLSSKTNGQGIGASHSNKSDRIGLPSPKSGTYEIGDPAASRVSSGVGRSQAGSSVPGAASGAAGTGEIAAQLPRWESADWPEQVRRVGQALNSGQIPASYRDVIRGYFDRK